MYYSILTQGGKQMAEKRRRISPTAVAEREDNPNLLAAVRATCDVPEPTQDQQDAVRDLARRRGFGDQTANENFGDFCRRVSSDFFAIQDLPEDVMTMHLGRFALAKDMATLAQATKLLRQRIAGSREIDFIQQYGKQAFAILFDPYMPADITREQSEAAGRFVRKNPQFFAAHDLQQVLLQNSDGDWRTQKWFLQFVPMIIHRAYAATERKLEKGVGKGTGLPCSV